MNLLPRLSPLLVTVALACGESAPEPCTRCPDVGGRYVLTRTIRSARDCPAAPAGGELVMHVGQNGSRIELEYEGAVLKGQLLDDGTLDATAEASRAEAGGTWRLSFDLTGSFRDAAGGTRLAATVTDTRVPVEASTNRGKTCVISAGLDGQR